MKNFKKVLALVLAVAMLMGFATIASAEAKTSEVYGDAADIQYVEAVDVLTAIGVLDGMNGDFKPNGTLTRAQAAKLIAMFDNGDNEINKLYAAANPFTDVVAGSWAESYIAYCYKMGIVGGVGGTLFAPNDQVTGIQFLKMVLCVLGYDAKEEGLEGTSWKVNTLALARDEDVNLIDVLGKKYDYDAPLSREAAAQIMLNALKAETVEYGISLKRGNFYTVAGAAGTGDYLYEEWDLTPDFDEVDAYGRPATKWSLAKVGEIGTYTLPADAAYTDWVAGCDLYDETGLLGKVDAVVVDENGVVEYDDKVTVVDSAAENARLNYVKDTNGVRQGRSVLMEVYLEDSGAVEEDTIFFIHTYLAEVKSVKAAKLDSKKHELAPAEVKLEVYGADTTVELWAEADGFAREDKALVTFGENEDGDLIIVTVDEAKEEVVTYDRKTRDNVMILDGKSAQLSKNFNLGYEMFEKPERYVTEDLTVWYDQYGRVIGAEEYAAAGSYGVVSAMWVEYYKGDLALKADFVFADGSEMEEVNVIEVIDIDGDVLDLDVLADDEDVRVNAASEFDPYTAVDGTEYTVYTTLFKFSVDKDEDYSLEAVAETAFEDNVELKTAMSRVKVDGDYYKLTDETAFIVEEEAAPRGEYNVFAGNDDLTAMDADVAVWDFDEDGIADIVLLAGTIYSGSEAIAWWNGSELDFVELVKDTDGNHYVYEVELAVLSDDGSAFETDLYYWDNGADILEDVNNFEAALAAKGTDNGVFNCYIDEDGYIVVDDLDTDVVANTEIAAAGEDGDFIEIEVAGEETEVELDEVTVYALIDGDDALVENEYDLYAGYDVTFILNEDEEVAVIIVVLDHVTFAGADVEFEDNDEVFAGRICDEELYRIEGATDAMTFTADNGATLTFDGEKGLTIDGVMPAIITVA